MTLTEARKEIDALDEQIIPLLEKRMRAAVLCGAEKKKAGIPLRDEKREAEILRRAEQMTEPTFCAAIRHVYSALFEACVELEKDADL